MVLEVIQSLPVRGSTTMIADVVAWLPQDELPLDELSEATQWVIEQQPEVAVRVYFTGITIFSKRLKQVKKLLGGHATQMFAIVVADEPLTEERAREVYDKYIKQLEEEDARGDGSGRDAGQSPDATEEPGTSEMGSYGTEGDTIQDLVSALPPVPTAESPVHRDRGSVVRDHVSDATRDFHSVVREHSTSTGNDADL